MGSGAGGVAVSMTDKWGKVLEQPSDISKALEQEMKIRDLMDQVKYIKEKEKPKVEVTAERVVKALEKRPKLLAEVRKLLWHESEGRVLFWNSDLIMLPVRDSTAPKLAVNPQVEGVYRLLLNFDCDTPCMVTVKQGDTVLLCERHDAGLFFKSQLIEITRVTNPLRIQWVKTEDSPEAGIIEHVRMALHLMVVTERG